MGRTWILFWAAIAAGCSVSGPVLAAGRGMCGPAARAGGDTVSLQGIRWVKGVTFTEGTLDVDLRGKDVFLKSFLGLAFHASDTGHYEVVFFRPFNFRHADTLRRKWSVQYMSMPGAPYDRLRAAHPLMYENAVNPVPDPSDWFHATIVVRGGWVTVYVNHSATPSLHVRAAIPQDGTLLGFWADGLAGDFANLRVSAAEPAEGAEPAAALRENTAHSGGGNGGYTVFNRTLTQENGYVHMNETDGDGVAWLDGKTWTDGTLECDIRGKDRYQQSFVGIAFHGADDSTFEAVYLRPFNFRTTDTLRRKHAIQYAAEPKFDWYTLRNTYPGKYEQPLVPEPDPNGWVHLKITVKGQQIKAYIDGATKPALVVTSLAKSGGTKIGLWAGNGSGGDWRDLKFLH